MTFVDSTIIVQTPYGTAVLRRQSYQTQEDDRSCTLHIIVKVTCVSLYSMYQQSIVVLMTGASLQNMQLIGCNSQLPFRVIFPEGDFRRMCGGL